MPIPNFNVAAGISDTDRLTNQQGIFNFNPNGYIDPSSILDVQAQIYQLQREAQEKQLATQYPQRVLASNFGQALGGGLSRLAGRALGTSPGNGISAQAVPQLPQQQTPVLSDIQRKMAQYSQLGDSRGEALAHAVNDLTKDPRYANDTLAQQYLDRAYKTAVETYKYDPKIDQERRNKVDNFVNPNTQQVLGFKQGTPEWQAATANNWPKASDQPTPEYGKTRTYLQGGLHRTDVWNGREWAPIATSTNPEQFIRSQATTGTPDQMRDAGLLSGISTAAASDKIKTEMSNREVATKNFDDLVGKIETEVQHAPGAIGKPGDIYEHVNDWVQTAKTLAGQVNQEELLDPKTYNWKGMDTIVTGLRGSGIEATKVHSMMLSAAYMMAAMQGTDNNEGRISKQRIEDNMEILAEHSSDPKAFLDTVRSARDTAINNLQNEAESKGYNLRWYGRQSQSSGQRPPKDYGVVDSLPSDLAPGDIVNGHKYKGGDTNKAQSWEQ